MLLVALLLKEFKVQPCYKVLLFFLGSAAQTMQALNTGTLAIQQVRLNPGLLRRRSFSVLQNEAAHEKTNHLPALAAHGRWRPVNVN